MHVIPGLTRSELQGYHQLPCKFEVGLGYFLPYLTQNKKGQGERKRRQDKEKRKEQTEGRCLVAQDSELCADLRLFVFLYAFPMDSLQFGAMTFIMKVAL